MQYRQHVPSKEKKKPHEPTQKPNHGRKIHTSWKMEQNFRSRGLDGISFGEPDVLRRFRVPEILFPRCRKLRYTSREHFCVLKVLFWKWIFCGIIKRILVYFEGALSHLCTLKVCVCTLKLYLGTLKVYLCNWKVFFYSVLLWKYTFPLWRYSFVNWTCFFLLWNIGLYFATMLASSCVKDRYIRGKESVVIM